ncbi:MAG: efflux RND transporter permease subunit [Deltaproteobacteria bacterium]|nr:efflux RND transporter permease subunit [Deltaproteobacteria bacterium]
MSGVDMRGGALKGIVKRFLTGPNAMLLLLLSLTLGVVSVLVTPREEEPQIVVPIADVMIEVPGHSADEIDRLVAMPLARLLYQIDGVEHVRSAAMRDRAVVTVNFYVGENREDAMTLLRSRIEGHLDELPPIVRSWIVRPIEVDDVPIVTMALSGEGYDLHQLRRVAEEVRARLDSLPELSRTQIYGGVPRQVQIDLDRTRLEGHDLTALEVASAIRRHGTTSVAGSIDRLDAHLSVDAGDGFRSAAELTDLEVAVRNGTPVRLGDVADVHDGPAELDSYTHLWRGAASPQGPQDGVPQVTLAISKQRGTDASAVATRVLAEVERLRADVLPEGIDVTLTRNYGASADRKVDDLLESIAIALITVIALLFFSLGYRAAIVVAVSVPVSFSLALFVNLLFGYTINRVTLFALILSLGLVVDDPITNVDNIDRHLRYGKGSSRDRVLAAVTEVLPPVLMSTLTVIVSFLPMFFITGMMGPYMQPMAANVPLAMGFSMLASLTIVPWLAHRLLGKKLMPNEDTEAPEAAPEESSDSLNEPATEGVLGRFYRATMGPLLFKRRRIVAMLGVVFALFMGANALAAMGLVPLKMLPFADKDELSLLVDMPEGTTLERTDALTRELARYLVTQSDVTDVEAFVGTPSPMDFGAMVRHDYLRRSPGLAELRIGLLPADEREQQSHAIGLRLRDELTAIAERHGAELRIVEVPPGPPVLATVVAEVYGDESTPYAELVRGAHELAGRIEAREGMAEVDVMAPEPHPRVHYALNRQQAAIHGIDEAQTTNLLGLAVGGVRAGSLRDPYERQPLPIRLRLPRAERSDAADLALLSARSVDGSLLPLGAIGEFETLDDDHIVYRKDLKPLVYVTAETLGIPPAEAILGLQSELEDSPLAAAVNVDWAGDGEWDITLKVFRDLGMAFGAALLFIYLLLVTETKSLVMPLLVMMAIPLTAIGIMPGFWLLNVISAGTVGGHPNPIFFTATAMIGMIALGGIVVRNALVLLEFIDGALARGASLREAILSSGAVRMRPILLTSATTALGAWPITLDPIFSGLAWALIFGLTASTMFTLFVVPATFYLLRSGKYAKKGGAEATPDATSEQGLELLADAGASA